MREGDLQLVLMETFAGNATLAPEMRFEMRRVPDDVRVGRLNLRFGRASDLLLYCGHIGYEVLPEHRGHHYAARSCRMVLPIAKGYGMGELWITCDPENAASRRTCELAGAELVEILSVPSEHELREHGIVAKCRYRLRVPA